MNIDWWINEKLHDIVITWKLSFKIHLCQTFYTGMVVWKNKCFGYVTALFILLSKNSYIPSKRQWPGMDFSGNLYTTEGAKYLEKVWIKFMFSDNASFHLWLKHLYRSLFPKLMIECIMQCSTKCIWIL